MSELYLVSKHPAVYPSSTKLDDGLDIGRGRFNDVRIQEPTVSRTHATILQNKNGTFEIKNLSSANPLFVNERAAELTELADGDAVRIGTITLYISSTPMAHVEQSAIQIPVVNDWDGETINVEVLENDQPAGESLNRILFRILELQRDFGLSEDVENALKNLRGALVDVFEACYVKLDTLDQGIEWGQYEPSPYTLDEAIALCAGSIGAVRLGTRKFNTLAYTSGTSVPVRVLLQGQSRVGNDIALLFVIGTLTENAINSLHQRRTSRIALERLRKGEASQIAIVGECAQTRELHNAIEIAARTDLNTLVTGESGTGKELVARNIHMKSKRKDGPLIAVNCAAINGELFESEFFGHVKGSFSGAVDDKEGFFSVANGGTLVLDEITELPVTKQSKLLRILEDGTYFKVGSTKESHADVRVLSLSNSSQSELNDPTILRQDLYHRLSQDCVRVPSLRDRIGDLEALIQHFADKLGLSSDTDDPVVSPEALKIMRQYSWPGNIRELRNCVYRGLAYSEGSGIRPENLLFLNSQERKETIPDLQGTTIPLEELERIAIQRALGETNGDVELAASLLKIGKSTLYRRIKDYGINPK